MTSTTYKVSEIYQKNLTTYSESGKIEGIGRKKRKGGKQCRIKLIETATVDFL
jgi:hypothetical protein